MSFDTLKQAFNNADNVNVTMVVGTSRSLSTGFERALSTSPSYIGLKHEPFSNPRYPNALDTTSRIIQYGLENMFSAEIAKTGADPELADRYNQLSKIREKPEAEQLTAYLDSHGANKSFLIKEMVSRAKLEDINSFSEVTDHLIIVARDPNAQLFSNAIVRYQKDQRTDHDIQIIHDYKPDREWHNIKNWSQLFEKEQFEGKAFVVETTELAAYEASLTEETVEDSMIFAIADTLGLETTPDMVFHWSDRFNSEIGSDTWTVNAIDSNRFKAPAKTPKPLADFPLDLQDYVLNTAMPIYMEHIIMHPNRIGAKTPDEIQSLMELDCGGRTFAEAQPVMTAAMIASLDPNKYPEKADMMEHFKSLPSPKEGETIGETFAMEIACYEEIARDIRVERLAGSKTQPEATLLL